MQAITWARSHCARNCTSSMGRWSLLQRGICSGWHSPLLLNLQINQIMPWAVETVSSSFREFRFKSEHWSGSSGVHARPWVRERRVFLSSTLPCIFITLLGAQCLWGLHQIWQNWPRNWNYQKRGRRILQEHTGRHAAGDALTWGPWRADWETRWGNLLPGFPKALDKY